MGTHPIFESDFDCLTDQRTLNQPTWIRPLLQSNLPRSPTFSAELVPKVSVPRSRSSSSMTPSDPSSETSKDPSERETSSLFSNPKEKPDDSDKWSSATLSTQIFCV